MLLPAKVLVANRGEIAIRIFRACSELGIPTVAVYSEEDAEALHPRQADEAVLLPSQENPIATYLNVPAVIKACLDTGATAVHPGYGFLSENGPFARACETNGIKFIG